MKTEITLFKYWLTGRKELTSSSITQSNFQIIYPLFLQIFDLSDFLTGNISYDQYKFVSTITKKVYSDVYNVSNFDNVPYSFVNLYTFFFHMFMDVNDSFLITTYKKQSQIAVIASLYTQNVISKILKINETIPNTPFIQIYAHDFYPGFTFKSEDEREHLPLNDFFDSLVTISSDQFLVTTTDVSGSWVTIPTFDIKLREYLYLKYFKLDQEFTHILNAKKTELSMMTQEDEIENQYGVSPKSRKQMELVSCKMLEKYIKDLVFFFCN